MNHKKIAMGHDKKIALVAHDNKKRDLVEWAKERSGKGPME
jgi:methylglyoxal synthase